MDPLLAATKVVIVVFVMPDCPGCEAYVPRLNTAIKRTGRPFYVHDGKTPAPRASIPVLYYDVSEPNEEVQAFATRFDVSATPTTIVLPRGEGVFKIEGGLADNQIDYVLATAREMNR